MGAKEHIILFPSLAQGHFHPFMALAAHLQRKNTYKITFVSTPLNIKRITSALPPNTTSITFTSIPFSSTDHGLPPNTESTDTLPYHLSLRLLQSTQTLQPAFENLISQITKQDDGHPPLAIISGIFHSWTTNVAHKLGIFHAVFVVSGAFGTAVSFSLWLNLPHRNTDADEFVLPDFPTSIHRSQLPNNLQLADGSDECSQLHRRLLPLCFNTDAFLFNTLPELEKMGITYFTSKANKPGWAIGPIVNVKQARKDPGVSEERCMSWLDLQGPRSVLYVSFGSQHTISASLIMELAMGLEASGRPFIWVIRPPLELDVNEEFRAEWLPVGFEERITERKQGMMVWRWAPQVEILSHPSTGAFLSHCGWNSTLEGLSRGVPLIGWPLSSEQFYNVMMLVELGVCVEVARGNSAKIEKGRLEKVIEVVMGGSDEGQEMRKKVLQVKEMMEEAAREDEMSMGSSVRGLNDFLMAAHMSRKANPGR